MTYNLFDVVKLKDKNNATILSKPTNDRMLAEIIDSNGKTIENREITKDEIVNIIFKH